LVFAAIILILVFAFIAPILVTNDGQELLVLLYIFLPQLMAVGGFLVVKIKKFDQADIFKKHNLSPFVISSGFFGGIGGIIVLISNRFYFVEFCGWSCKVPIWSVKYIKHAILYYDLFFWIALICDLSSLAFKENAYKKLAQLWGYIFCLACIFKLVPFISAH